MPTVLSLTLARFNYMAADAAGFHQSGVLIATTLEEAVHSLFARKLLPISLAEVPPKTEDGRAITRKLKESDLVSFIRELASLLSSGVGLTDSLSTLHEATKNSGLQEVLSRLIFSVQSGEKFSEALRGSQISLPEYVYALTRAGEATGNIGMSLQRCADQMEFDERMQAETREALIYPAILILTGIVAIGFIFTFVVPRFAGLLNGRNVDLPLVSSLVLTTGLFVNTHWIAFVIGSLAVGLAAMTLVNLPNIRTHLIALASRMPVFSSWLRGAETARWTSILSVLAQSRVPILTALDLAASSVRLEDNAKRLRSMQDEVRLGKTLSQATEERRMLEGSALSMLKVGEKTGDIAGMLGHIASHAAEHHRALQRRLVALIEPVSILVIGLVIGVIMVGVVLAMTSLTEVKL